MLLADCHEVAGYQNKLSNVPYDFDNKTQYILSHAPYTHIVVFWHISNIALGIS